MNSFIVGLRHVYFSEVNRPSPPDQTISLLHNGECGAVIRNEVFSSKKSKLEREVEEDGDHGN